MSDEAKMARLIPVECADGAWIVADFSLQPGLINRDAIFAIARLNATALALLQEHDRPDGRNAALTLPFSKKVRRRAFADGRGYDLKRGIFPAKLIENP
jgi:hypothetical protein